MSGVEVAVAAKAGLKRPEEHVDAEDDDKSSSSDDEQGERSAQSNVFPTTALDGIVVVGVGIGVGVDMVMVMVAQASLELMWSFVVELICSELDSKVSG